MTPQQKHAMAVRLCQSGQHNGAHREAQSNDSPLSSSATPLESSPRNILLVHELLPHYDCSGADLRLYELVRELRAQNHVVTVLARDNRNEARYRPPLEALGAKVFSGDPERLRHLGNDAACSWQLSEVLKNGRFDIAILSHWFWSGISVPEHYLGEIRKHSPSTKILVLSEDRHGERERRSAQLTGFLSDIERGNNFEQREVEIYRRADMVLYVTETDQKRFLELIPDLQTEHLPTIAEAGECGPSFANREGILFLGNFENLANRDALDWLLKNVWTKVRQQEPSLNLYIAGFAAPEGLEARHPGVICLGKVDELGPLFARHRVFAAPIRYGTGIITKNMHALAHGLPVVTTSVGAEGMQLLHNTHSLIADTPEDFVSAILRLNRDESLWQKTSIDGRNYIRSKFSLDNLQSQIRKIITRTDTLRARSFDPHSCWSYREVETVFPEVLHQKPVHYRNMLRTLGYWRLGRRHLDARQPSEALTQFRHVFTFIRGRLPASVFHYALLDDMARCYRALHDEKAASRCEIEKQNCIWSWETKASPSINGNRHKKKSKNRSPEISVVLPTYNRSGILRVCLAALAFQSLPVHRWEVVVVDDGSTDSTESFVRNSLFPFRLKYLRQTNRGTGAARRSGVEAACSEFLLLCNDDTIASSNLLVEHLHIHRKFPRKKRAVLGEFRPSEDVAQRALSLFVNTSPFLFPQRILKEGQLYDQAYFVTCNLSVRRDAILDVGNFDSAFRVAEDTELGTRLAERGFRVYYHPAALAWHEHSQFTIQDLTRRARIYGETNWLLFQKHPKLLGSGAGPFGKLTPEDEFRMQSQLDQYRSAVTSGVTALEALDQIDFRLFFLEQNNGHKQAEEVMQHLGQLVPMIYWHFLFERFLEKWREARSKNTSSLSIQPEQFPAIISEM